MNTCVQCTPGCDNCTGAGLDKCQTCKTAETVTVNPDSSTTTTYTLYYKHIGDDTCGETCPVGQFIHINISNFCQSCSIECKECQDNSKHCIDAASCNAGYFFLPSDNSCLSVCPDGFYANTSTTTCTPCHLGCALCKGGALTQCTSCNADIVTDPLNPVSYFKRIGYTECTLTCDAGQYEDPSDFLCKYCHNSCSECLNGNENCTGCKNVSGISFFLYNPAQ